ncbi:hypothetical protein Tco_0405131 [Tanacetum coccineum]
MIENISFSSISETFADNIWGTFPLKSIKYLMLSLVKSEARVAREAWAQSMSCSRAVHDKLQAYQTHTQIQDTHISSLEALVTTLVSQTTSLQTQLIAALGCIDTLETREPAHTDDPEDADSCS